MHEKPRRPDGSLRKTCRRYDDPGHAHALTFSCFRGQAFLSRDRSRQWFVEAVEQARTRHGFDVWAYVIMPEHVHLLIFPTRTGYSVSAILASIKRPVASRAINHVTRHAPRFLDRMTDVQPNGESAYRFWQRGGGYDRNLWSPDYVWELIDYIHANPVRRGLCRLPQDWKWSSARFYLGLGSGPLTVTPEHLPRDPRGMNRR